MAKKTSSNKTSGLDGMIPKIKWDESYVSLAIGVVVVIIIAVLGIAFLRNTDNSDTSSTLTEPVIEDEAEEPGQTGKNEKGETVYVVKTGDTLWSIAENKFKSGYNWVDISEANKLENPNIVTEGTKLVIPEVEAKKMTVSEASDKIDISMEEPENAISGKTYKTVEGDNLWEIAVRAYGDGYSWVKLSKANKLEDPNIILVGQELQIPR